MLNCLQVIHDIRYLEEQVRGDYLQHVLKLLSSCSPDVLESIRQSILLSGQSLKSVEPLVIKAVVESLVEKSVEVGYSLCLFFKLVALFRYGVVYNYIYFQSSRIPFFSSLPFQFIHFFLLFKNNLGLETNEGDNSNLQDD